MRGSFRLVLALAAVASVAAADYPSGNWGNGLVPEPNTEHDWTDGWMFANPPRDPNSAVRRVYLDAHVVQRPMGDVSTGTTGNPGVMYQVFAFFGVWKDCNADGAIGHGALDLLDYPSVLLLNVDICNSGSGLHNQNGLVREFIWITPESLADPGMVPRDGEFAGEGLVWADFGNPGDDYDSYAATPVRTEDVQGAPPPKRAPDFLLRYHRGAALSEVARIVGDNSNLELLTPGMLDPTHGLGALLCEHETCTGWWSDPVVVSNPGVQTDERTVTAGSSPSLRVTTTAYVDDSAIGSYGLSLPGYNGVYGAAQCQGLTSGIHHGWDCDYQNWPSAPPPWIAVTGGLYNSPVVHGSLNLRDVDPFNAASHANPLG